MRAERPLIASVIFLATGLSLIFGYCTGLLEPRRSIPPSHHLRFTLNIVNHWPSRSGRNCLHGDWAAPDGLGSACSDHRSGRASGLA